jgi:hypothetical protein
MLFSFTNICGEMFLARAFVPSMIIGTILPKAVAIKSIGFYLRKSSSAVAPKMLAKLAPRVNVIKFFCPIIYEFSY